MNISHVEEIRPKGETDMLVEIFKCQESVMCRFKEVERGNGVYVPDRLDIDNPKDQNYIKDIAYRIISEIVEATECLKNKPWKESHVITDVEHMKEEIADSLHFFVELCILVGMSPGDLYNYYMRKNKVNHWRRDTGY